RHEGARVRGARRPRRAPAGQSGSAAARTGPVTDAAIASQASSQTEGVGPLAGVRVVELGMLLAGPFSARLLGDMGAEIIKIEPPGQPDPLRDWGKARDKGRSL